MSLVELRDISKKFGTDSVAVSKVDLSVYQGELLALTGESGCGKTTLLRLISGLEKPDSGTITIDGRSVAGNGIPVPPQNRPVGLVFQDYALFPHMSVEQNVAFGLRPWPDDQRRQRLREMLELVNLAGLENRYPHQLSGGQQQRVAIARALAPDPKLLLLDEPFSNLDTVLKDQVRQEIASILRRSGTTAILVTHDVQDALSMADRIAVLKEGRVLQVDSPQKLYQQPVNSYVASFFGKVNLIPVMRTEDGIESEIGKFEMDTGSGVSGFLCLRPRQVQVILTGDTGAAAKILAVCYQGGYQQLDLAAGPCKLCCYEPLGISYEPGQSVRVSFDLKNAHVIWDPY
jgi:iron(III) transport system ATP-binding protein